MDLVLFLVPLPVALAGVGSHSSSFMSSFTGVLESLLKQSLHSFPLPARDTTLSFEPHSEQVAFGIFVFTNTAVSNNE